MTREEAIKEIEIIDRLFVTLDKEERQALKMAIEALEQGHCEDCVSREAVMDLILWNSDYGVLNARQALDMIGELPSVTPKQKMGRCKDCKYFEYDSVAKVDGIPLIVAHEICSKWGDGCKTKEDGYCFLFEPQESEDKE